MVTETAGEVSLTDVEQALVDHVTRGELLDLAAAEPVDEAAMRSWDSSRTIRAAVLRDILRGRLAPVADPHGLRLRGARIAGQLDLENLTTSVWVELYDCLLGEGLAARDATLPGLVLSGCRLEHPAEPPLAADRLTAAVLVLDRAVITAACETGAVGLLGAHLGRLECDGARLRNDAGPALRAERLQVDQDVFLRGGFEAVGTSEDGAVRLLGAHLGGQLDCTGATIRNDTGPALHADSLQVDQAVFLSSGFEAVGAGDDGVVRLPGAHLGRLQCNGARLRNDAGPALYADSLQVDQDVHLSSRFEAVGAGDDGAVWLLGAHVGGQLNCTDATIRNDTGPAFVGDGLQVGRSVHLSSGFEAVGAGDDGVVRLPGAHLGRLECDGARLRNDTGPALRADGLQVDQDVFLRSGFEAIGAGEDGAVRLPGAYLDRLQCDGARLRNDTGPALHADGLQVDQNVHLSGGFDAVGAGDDGAVRLPGAHIHGQLDCTDATIRNDTGPALVADGLQVDQDVFLSGGFEAVGAGSDVTLRLSQARIGGELEFAPARLDHTTDPQARLALDGLTYAGLPVSSLDWLDLLREATPSYAAQPYQQFAGAHRAAGHDGEVRKILMAQRQAQIDRGALTGRAERAWARLTKLTLGYGYQPWRALIALVFVVMIAVVLALTLGAHGGVARVDPHPPTATRCSAVERVGVGLDLGLPLIKTGARALCDTTASATGQGLTAAGWGLQLLAWAFATLFVAGFTGAVRKT
jgi:hypothetical protein